MPSDSKQDIRNFPPMATGKHYSKCCDVESQKWEVGMVLEGERCDFLNKKLLVVLSLIGLVLIVGMRASGQTIPKDPGVRGGPAGAGGTFTTLDSNPMNSQADHDFFLQTKDRFQEVDSVSGTIESGVGLGPVFNLNSCAGCHIQPAIGGSSPATNPQLTVAHLDGAINDADTSDFLSPNGPIREVRFIRNPDGSPDGVGTGLKRTHLRRSCSQSKNAIGGDAVWTLN
jgi:hypothetical protein